EGPCALSRFVRNLEGRLPSSFLHESGLPQRPLEMVAMSRCHFSEVLRAYGGSMSQPDECDRPASFVPYGQIVSRNVDWMWPGRLALGKLAILEGDPGLGKSFLALDLCARLSTGQPWPDGSATAGP